MKVLLLYPPISNLRYPYLSLPSLSAFLKEAGHRPISKDVNLEAFYDVIPPSEGGIGGEEMNPPLVQEAKGALMDQGVGGERRELARGLLMKTYLTYYKGFEAEISRSSLVETLREAMEGRNDPFESYYRERLIPWVLGEDPSLVGLSIAYPTQMIHGFRIAFLIRKASPRIHICMGGPTITKLLDHLMGHEELLNAADSFILLHGELPLLRLAEALEEGEALESVPNAVFKKEGRWHWNRIPYSPIDMDSIPPPDFEGFPLGLYLLKNFTLPLITSRGCYWKRCSFCTYREFYKDAFDQRDATLVVEDMAKLHHQYGCSHFRFMDDACSPAFLRSLARQIIRSRLKVRWSCFARFERPFTNDLLRLLAKGGCKRLMFGLESYNQRILDLMKKGVRVEEIGRIVEGCHEVGIETRLMCMVGFPTETRSEALETMRFLVDYRGKYTSFVVQPFNLEGGTEIDCHPERFGITRVHRGDRVSHGLRYGYRFETRSGMGMEEAGRMGEYITRKVREAGLNTVQ
ncbi:MAG: B12-binding domain-containing radical SAM protein [Thermodesulfobacteriota bacterium]